MQDYTSAIDKGAQSDRVFTARAALKRVLNDKEGALKDYQMAVSIRPHSGSLQLTGETRF
jgi:Tfp pilus assembly protein PilF